MDEGLAFIKQQPCDRHLASFHLILIHLCTVYLFTSQMTKAQIPISEAIARQGLQPRCATCKTQALLCYYLTNILFVLPRANIRKLQIHKWMNACN